MQTSTGHRTLSAPPVPSAVRPATPEPAIDDTGTRFVSASERGLFTAAVSAVRWRPAQEPFPRGDGADHSAHGRPPTSGAAEAAAAAAVTGRSARPASCGAAGSVVFTARRLGRICRARRTGRRRRPRASCRGRPRAATHAEAVHPSWRGGVVGPRLDGPGWSPLAARQGPAGGSRQ